MASSAAQLHLQLSPCALTRAPHPANTYAVTPFVNQVKAGRQQRKMWWVVGWWWVWGVGITSGVCVWWWWWCVRVCVGVGVCGGGGGGNRGRRLSEGPPPHGQLSKRWHARACNFAAAFGTCSRSGGNHKGDVTGR